jgi:hypothetical protein
MSQTGGSGYPSSLRTRCPEWESRSTADVTMSAVDRTSLVTADLHEVCAAAQHTRTELLRRWFVRLAAR